MENIEVIKSKSKKAKIKVKDIVVQLSDCIEHDDGVDIDECEELVCAIDSSKSKVQSKIRK